MTSSSFDPIGTVLRYHSASKHDFDRYAPGPGQLDWRPQSAPLRSYEGAAKILLHRDGLELPDFYDAVFSTAARVPAPLDRHSLSAFFYHSLAVFAWKSAGGNPWALRVNPSSGNLHPTECYLVAPPVERIVGVQLRAHAERPTRVPPVAGMHSRSVVGCYWSSGAVAVSGSRA